MNIRYFTSESKLTHEQLYHVALSNLLKHHELLNVSIQIHLLALLLKLTKSICTLATTQSSSLDDIL